MHWRKWIVRSALCCCLLLSLAACDTPQFGGTTPSVLDLTQRPAEFANNVVTITGYYLWKPGNPGLWVLVPGVSTADEVRDAQPIYASVECAPDGSCKPSTTKIGTPETGGVWLQGFPAAGTAKLHNPGGSVGGGVEESGGF